MIGRFAFVLALAALEAWGQAPQPTVYVSAQYLKWMPGMAEEGRKFATEVSNKVAVARNNAGGTLIGQVRLYRVFPTGHEAGHDTLRLLFRSSPPDLGATGGTPAAQLAGTGLTPAEYAKKLAAFAENVKVEIWTDVFRHGSMSEGDFVRVSYVDPPKDLTAEYATFEREQSSGMAEELIKKGTIKGWDVWRLSLTPNSAPYNFVSVVVNKDSSDLFKSFGKQTEAYSAAHPTGDYNRYFIRYRELNNVVKTVVYRVDSAIWK